MSALPPGQSRLARVFEALARLQVRHAGRFLMVAALVVLVSLVLASQLELRLRFEQLLPEGRPSVVALARLQENVPTGSRAFVVVEGGRVAAQRAFADELVRRLRARAPSWLADVSAGIGEARAFLEPRAGLFVELKELQQLRDDVEARWSWEVARETGALLDDDEPPPELTPSGLEQRFASRLGAAELERFPGGYFAAKDGSALVVAVAASVGSGELERMREALTLIEGEASALARSEYPELKLSYAGDLVTGLAEYGAVVDDLLSVGVLGVGLVVVVLFLFFWRVRALVALSLTLLIGLSVTFGLTRLSVGHLNVATGFLVSIVAGNGINFGILYLARYFEECRTGSEPQAAVQAAHAQTWPGTLAAALAAAAAYGSLGVSEFRAFRDFAVIGSLGMIVCLLSSHLVLPPLVLVLERLKQALPARFSLHARGGGAVAARFTGLSLSAPLLALVSRAPRSVAVMGVGLALAGVIALVPYVRRDPLEYDMRQMQNNVGTGAEMYRASKVAASIMGAKLDSSMVLLADTPQQVPALKRALEARRDGAADGLKPFEAVHTAFDFVPADQARKLELLGQIQDRLLKARRRGFVSDADFARVAPYLPPAGLEPWELADLPSSIARPFTDRAGVIGRLALIEPTAGESDSNVKYLMRWADSFRSVTLPSGEIIHGSGRAVIFADILATVLSDIPRTVVLAFVLTLVTVLVAFRRGVYSLIVIASLLVGLGWVALAMSIFDLKINFFNFVALPVSFGIGVDYAVNLVQRYAAEPERGALAALRSTGGAVVLCSLTTIVGYLALLISVNQAIRSLGVLAVLGELGCLAAATLVLPALLLLRERRAASRESLPTLEGASRADPIAG